jgi:hypothetical protein
MSVNDRLPAGKIHVYGVEDIEGRSNIGRVLEFIVDKARWNKMKQGDTTEAWDNETHSVVLITKWTRGKARDMGRRCRSIGFLTFSTRRVAEGFAQRADR